MADKLMTMDEAIAHMKANPGVKMSYQGWRSFEYAFCDKNGFLITENGHPWDVGLSKFYSEDYGYYLWDGKQ